MALAFAFAFAFAFDEADLRGATLVVVHSWNGLPAATWHPADPAQLAADADRNLAEALEPWRDKYPAVPVVYRMAPSKLLAYLTRTDALAR
jgi:hypothetical protein